MTIPATPFTVIRARDWLRSFDLPFRDAMLLNQSDGQIHDIATEDGYRLTCDGDIQRERDAALQREAA